MKYNLIKIFTIFLILITFTIPNITSIGDCSLVVLEKSPNLNNKLSDDINIISMTYYGNIIIVDDDGDDNYTKIQDAIDNSSKGDLIKVFSGNYFESITINKQLTLVGIEENDEGKPVIDADGDEFAVTFTADNCVFEGFKVMNTSKDSEDLGYAGIKLLSDNNLLKNNTIVDNYDGIWLENSDGNIIENNNILLNKVGIFILESCNNTINSNFFSNNKLAIQTWYHSDNNTITTNEINGTGIILSESSNNEISNNIITSYFQHSITGIGLQQLCYRNKIIGNIVSNMDIGLGIFSSHNNIISQNNITNNSLWGILFDRSHKNKIKYNNFIKNGGSDVKTPRIFYSPAFFLQSFLNHWGKNYWDDWQHSLIPRPIKGKLGKNMMIPWRNFDWHPAKEPYDI